MKAKPWIIHTSSFSFPPKKLREIHSFGHERPCLHLSFNTSPRPFPAIPSNHFSVWGGLSCSALLPSPMAGTGNRYAVVTPDDHGPVVAIATWFLMVSMILSVLIRVAIRLVITRAPGREDITIVGAMVLPFTSFKRIRDHTLLTGSICSCLVLANRLQCPWQSRTG